MPTRDERKLAREFAKQEGRIESQPQAGSGGEIAGLLTPTHEPPAFPADRSFPQIEVHLTGEETMECIAERIRGQLHYLHASSAGPSDSGCMLRSKRGNKRSASSNEITWNSQNPPESRKFRLPLERS